MSVDAAIRFVNVTFSDKEMIILKNITGYFPRGKITTIVGPSGAGKTTLFRLCNGLLSPDSGEIIIQGKAIEEYDPIRLRRLVGLALQSAPMINGTVRDNLALPLNLQGKELSEAEAVKFLGLVGLDKKFLHHSVKDLSGGQKQKVSIARTLLNRPKILLLDEITSSLDIGSRQEIASLIKQINQNFGTTIAWITHNLQEALEVGDYSWFMMNGEVIESGDTSFLKSPRDERTLAFTKGEIQ